MPPPFMRGRHLSHPVLLGQRVSLGSCRLPTLSSLTQPNSAIRHKQSNSAQDVPIRSVCPWPGELLARPRPPGGVLGGVGQRRQHRWPGWSATPGPGRTSLSCRMGQVTGGMRLRFSYRLDTQGRTLAVTALASCAGCRSFWQDTISGEVRTSRQSRALRNPAVHGSG
jgi:hypothetical protein